MIRRTQVLASHSKEIRDEAMCRQKSLGLSRRFEPAHLSFSEPGWLMRKLCPIVGILSRVVRNAGQDRSFCRTIALQFVGDDLERFRSLASHQSAEEPLGCLLMR